MSNNVQILIRNGDKFYEPLVEEGISWETERKGAPGKLTFKVLKDDVIDFTEGNTVTMTVDGADVFYGYVFTKTHDKDGLIGVTAYDQLRYLKNKDCYIYSKAMTATELIKALAADYQLKLGEIEDTEYVIEKRVEDNSTLFDIIQTALDLTLDNKKKRYVLYDDFGKLMLKQVESMRLDLLIDAQTAENYGYTSSIDSHTYNRIRLFYENSVSGERQVVTAPKEDTGAGTIQKWGVLQYSESVDEKTLNPQAKAEALLEIYNKKTRNLSIDNAFGDIRVRAGTSVVVQFDLGDIKVNDYMLVERTRHVFNDRQHLMSLDLQGGEFT